MSYVMERLTDFQADALTAANNADTPTGQNLLRWIEDNSQTHERVNHGRLYPNLDELVDKGLLYKDNLDKRTNLYVITEEGREWLKARAEFLSGASQ